MDKDSECQTQIYYCMQNKQRVTSFFIVFASLCFKVLSILILHPVSLSKVAFTTPSKKAKGEWPSASNNKSQRQLLNLYP